MKHNRIREGFYMPSGREEGTFNSKYGAQGIETTPEDEENIARIRKYLHERHIQQRQRMREDTDTNTEKAKKEKDYEDNDPGSIKRDWNQYVKQHGDKKDAKDKEYRQHQHQKGE
jgi:hypothetical protein